MALLVAVGAKSTASLVCSSEVSGIDVAQAKLVCDALEFTLSVIPQSAVVAELVVVAGGFLTWKALGGRKQAAPAAVNVASDPRPPNGSAGSSAHDLAGMGPPNCGGGGAGGGGGAAGGGGGGSSSSSAPLNGKKSTAPELFKEQDASPKFFTNLLLAHDGGFSEVPELFHRMRYFSALLSFVMTCLNVRNVLLWDLTQLKPKMDAAGSHADHLLVTAKLLHTLSPDAPYPVEAILAACELLCLSHLFGRCCLLLWKALVAHGFARWSAAGCLAWQVVPTLQSFSAMRLLQLVSPAVLAQDAKELKRHCGELMSTGAVLQALASAAWFLLSRVLVAILGFDAFILKFGHASTYLHEGVPVFLATAKIGLFLHQIMGIVQVKKFTMARIFVFIFGGEDAKVEPHEQVVLDVWLALLAKRMWQCYPGRPDRALAVMLTFDDVDFQKLALNERS